MSVKQVIVIRKDLKMRRGKECAQVAHAAMKWFVERLREQRDVVDAWIQAGMDSRDRPPLQIALTSDEDEWLYGDEFTKVVVCVDSEAELERIYQTAKNNGLESHMIVDAGFTEFKGVPTKTCVAIGPDQDIYIDEITGKLRLY